MGCCPHPHWRTHIFQDGVAKNHQPEIEGAVNSLETRDLWIDIKEAVVIEECFERKEVL